VNDCGPSKGGAANLYVLAGIANTNPGVTDNIHLNTAERNIHFAARSFPSPSQVCVYEDAGADFANALTQNFALEFREDGQQYSHGAAGGRGQTEWTIIQSFHPIHASNTCKTSRSASYGDFSLSQSKGEINRRESA
jgi:hypothetical protein